MLLIQSHNCLNQLTWSDLPFSCVRNLYDSDNDDDDDDDDDDEFMLI